MALNTGVDAGSEPGLKAFLRCVTNRLICSQGLRFAYVTSSPVGVYPKPENCVFVPIPCELRFNEAERSGRTSSRILFFCELLMMNFALRS